MTQITTVKETTDQVARKNKSQLLLSTLARRGEMLEMKQVISVVSGLQIG